MRIKTITNGALVLPERIELSTSPLPINWLLAFSLVETIVY